MSEMRTMADSIGLAALEPVAAQFDLLAGYDDGAWPDAAAIAARFPGKLVLRVTTDPADDEGDMLDVETGDATPAQAPGWVTRRRAAGHGGPLVYCAEAAWPTVRSQFAAQHVAEPGYVVAAYPGAGPTIPPGAVGHQYAGTVQGPGGPYDVSVVVDHLPGIDPDPVPEADMRWIIATYQNAEWLVFVTGGQLKRRWIRTPADVGVLVTMGAIQTPLPAGYMAALPEVA